MQNKNSKINLRNGIIDSHFHLFHMKKRGMNHLEIIEQCFDSGLEYALDIGINPENFQERIKTALKYPGLYTAHGYYPSECTSKELDSSLAYLESCLSNDSKALALGEIGFDFFHEYGNKSLQEALLRDQLKIADKLDLPVIIHSRDAEAETLQILANETPSRGGIIHCFSYSAETALKFIDMGFYISFAGNLTYKKSKTIQQAAALIPVDRILLETDAPYLSPQKVRGLMNHPGYIGYTYDCLAEIKNINIEELIPVINNNFKTLFRL